MYESEYRGKIQNRDQEATLILPNEHTYQIYKSIAPDNALALFEQAYKEAQEGNINQAIIDFGKVIEINDHFAEAYYNRGLLRLLVDDPNNALPDLSKAGELGIYQAYNIIKKNQNNKLKQKPTP